MSQIFVFSDNVKPIIDNIFNNIKILPKVNLIVVFAQQIQKNDCHRNCSKKFKNTIG